MICARMAPVRFAARMRRASRIALYSTVLLVLAVTWALIALLDRPPETQESEQWIFHDYRHDPAVLMLQKYAQIDTSDATGNEVAGARFLAAQLAAAGIPSQIEV